MPQYSGVWSLQQQMQALTSGQWATDPLFDYTTLLLQGDAGANGAQNNVFYDTSPNQFAITRNGNTTQGTFSPFSATGWSNYFSGSSDYLTSTGGSGVQVGTGDFTIEFWVYSVSPPTGADYDTIVTFGGAASGAYGVELLPGTTSSQYKVRFESFSTGYITTATDISANTWTHVAVVKNGSGSNNLRIYVNGISDGTATISENLTPSATTIYIGTPVWNVGNRLLNGYVSNLRLLKGTAQYTSNFTPPTSPLTAITNTQLLTCQSNRFVDSSSNAFSFTTNGTPSVQAFSPFAPQFQYTASGTGGSGYFDGTGDYLNTAASAAFDFGTGAFTVEAWFYPTDTVSDGIVATSNGTQWGAVWIWTFGTEVRLRATASTSGADLAIGGGAFQVNAWNHVAGVRSGNDFSLYLNGTRVATGTSTTALKTGCNAAIGCMYDNSYNSFYNGYIASVRMVKGGALYSGTTYTVPTAPFTTSVSAGTVSLLTNFTNAGILDGTMKNNLETVGNAQVSTSVVKYGSGSMYFDGSGDGLVSPISKLFDFGSGNFTIEFWANCVSTSGTGFFASVWEDSGGSDSNSSWLIRLNSGTIITHLMQGGATYNTLTSPTISTNTWFHFAWVRNGNTQTMYINGIAVATGSVSGAMNSVIRQFRVGYQGVATNYLTGYIDDFRITNGIARYTQNFIPPSVALPRQ